ncbi:MAG: glutamate synthase-related protein [Chloroflexota bacterium]|nr:glutamate synthase-related protein [Chloroflexota bacterium]
MPKKYHVKTETLHPKFEPVSEFCSIEVAPCLRCKPCVKYSACIYRVFEKREFDPVQVVDTGDSQCMSCLRCVQECKANILTRSRNTRYDALGDDYWKPTIIHKIWNQAETGKIPVSGAGYRGPFTGFGFDQMWTDMSEIVRPTRDGIHGREYISTVVELGRKPERLEFDESGNLLTELPPFLELQLPVFLCTPHMRANTGSAQRAIVKAAANLHTIALADFDKIADSQIQCSKDLGVRFDIARHSVSELQDCPLLELAYSDDVMNVVSEIKSKTPNTLISIRLPLDEHATDRASSLTKAGAEIIHLQANSRGNGFGLHANDFATGLVRDLHLRLVSESIRDQITLMISGGIAMAEHVAKIIICGVDAVGVDQAILPALECRLCRECEDDVLCPVHLEEISEDYGSQRIVNLIGSWHSQLIEVMGAMGIREVRRLRGEVGRAMFFDDLEKENFSPLFGERVSKKDVGSGEVALHELPSMDGLNGAAFPLVEGLVKNCSSRFRNRISMHKVVRTKDCISCGKCAEVCMWGVHDKPTEKTLPPRSHLCVGADRCRAEGAFCADVCPKNAIRVGQDPVWDTFGDPRWTPDLIVSTWIQAETGRPPNNGLEYRVGASGGGFDQIEFVFPDKDVKSGFEPKDVDLSIPLNRRKDSLAPRIEIGFPVYGGGMSFGAISLAAIVSRAKAYSLFKSFTCTGEGGYPDALIPYQNHVITQVATGLFGVREETIQRSPIIEFKYAQGAKPGLGGHLLGDKVTAAVAKIRESVEGNALFSPFPFHSVYSVEDHKKHVDWIKAINRNALVSVKVSSPTDVDMVAVGSYYAGAHIIHIDGSYGGTGAAPDIAKKNIAMPIEYAITRVHRFLVDEGIRDEMTLIASGGIRTAWDIAKAIALGADGVVIATADLVALECVRCGRCESGRGCPRGIATTDQELSLSFSYEWSLQRLINLFHSYAIQLQEILWRFGMKEVKELVGRSDLLRHKDYVLK